YGILVDPIRWVRYIQQDPAVWPPLYILMGRLFCLLWLTGLKTLPKVVLVPNRGVTAAVIGDWERRPGTSRRSLCLYFIHQKFGRLFVFPLLSDLRVSTDAIAGFVTELAALLKLGNAAVPSDVSFVSTPKA
ncbi:hypothetical protein ISCGN_010552, partial [Ixodes scapularis]